VVRIHLREPIYRGVEESGRPRWSHKPEIVGSNPTSATSLNVMEVPVATKRLGIDRNVKSEITDSSVSTPQLPLCSLKSFLKLFSKMY
jgi:hypothetical protein